MNQLSVLEIAAVAGLLLVAIAPLFAGRVLAGRRSLALAWLAGVVVLTVLSVWSFWPSGAVDETALLRPEVTAADGYLGSDACQGCHPDAYASWHASFHRRMTQVASPDSIIPEFDGRTVVARGRPYLLERDGDAYFVEMVDPSWSGDPAAAPRVRRRIVMTTGSHHEQDFWTATEHPRSVQHLPIVYRIAEARWLPNGSTFMRPPLAAGEHLVPELGGWNRNCIQCHATHGQPRLREGGAETRVAELGIACEACHGPGAEHAARFRDPQARYGAHLSDAGDLGITHPGRLDHRRSAMVCGQCHSIARGHARDPDWIDAGQAYRPGDDLDATREISRGGDPTQFWPDGVVRVSGREYNGLLESPCFVRGELDCLSCHQLHRRADDVRPAEAWADDQLAPGLRDTDACLECHPALVAGAAAHSRHEGAGAPGCYDCHMPYTTFGLLKSIRSHTVESPSVATELATGRPNGCNLCHLDRSLGWTAEQLSAWTGEPAPALDDDRRDVAAAAYWLLTGDAGLRALAADAFGRQDAVRASQGERWMPLYLAYLLDDPYDAVRFVAARALRRQPGFGSLDYDFIAERPQRAAVQAAILAEWRSPEPPAHGEALLVGADGTLDRPAVARLEAERDDRPVSLRE